MQPRRTSRTAAPPTIEGEAVVIGRRAGSTSPRLDPNARPLNDNRPPEAEPPHRAARPFRPDLVFPGAVRWPAAVPARRGVLPRIPGRLPSLAATGCVGLALAAGVLLAAAPGARPPAPAAPLFALTETRSSVVRHGQGAVLAVEGRIRNVSPQARDVPAVIVTAGGAAGFDRTIHPGKRPLGPGRSLFFHSTLAVPSATTANTVGVILAGTD